MGKYNHTYVSLVSFLLYLSLDIDEIESMVSSTFPRLLQIHPCLLRAGNAFGGGCITGIILVVL